MKSIPINFKGSLRKPIDILNKSLYIKLLSVYEMMLCESTAQSLVIKFINEGLERSKAQSVAENICLCMMCLYNEDGSQVFSDVESVMVDFTPDELLLVINEYEKFRKEHMGFDKFNDQAFEMLKKN